jgi:uncharacterized protein
MARFEMYKDRKEEYRWRLLAKNNRIIAVSQGYSSEAACRKGIKSVRKNAPKAKIKDISKPDELE